jgi:uncharacterized protein YecE (DUF72 family)
VSPLRLPGSRDLERRALTIADVWIGTSGFAYPHWRQGVFYPDGLPVASELEYYARHFRTVELNNPFYRLPDRATFAHWRQRTPTDFRFAVKASRFITHIRRLRDCKAPVATLLDRVGGLGRKCGPVLFQLPPTLSLDLDRLRAFLRELPARRRFVLEFRHPSWLCDPVMDLLRRQNIAVCEPVGSTLESGELEPTASFAYFRLHFGRGAGGNFTPGQLRHYAGRVRSLRRKGIETWVYFNNDRYGCAVRNAESLARLLHSRSRARHPRS